MINSYVSAKLVDYATIKISIFSNVPRKNNSKIYLLKNDEAQQSLKIIKETFLNGISLIECKSNKKIKLGNEYSIVMESFGKIPLNVEDITSLESFDKEYYYNKNDLGFRYTKLKTTWKVWAPLASKVVLFLKKNNEKFNTYIMKRKDHGVYELTLNGDFENYKYRYQVTNNGVASLATDPYGIASTANGHDSVIIDVKKTKINLNEKNLPIYKSYTDSIIYELNVRDFTIDKNTSIKNKGKFLGLAEQNTKTMMNNLCGLDYLSSLNITHVQLLPIFDFKTVDELHPNKEYNWGYDPAQYFVPEGSYSTNPNDGYNRIIECKKMIAALHKRKIKVNMDVVYNHVYEYENSVFEKIVPNYYFRRHKNGTLSNGSGCGNDLDTTRPMVRKLILDSAKHWIKFYGVDGFRIDLMGLIDIETINELYKLGKSIKPDFMIYGEGWNLDTTLGDDKKSTIYNASKLENIGFFNDVFRDIIRGPNKTNEKGFLIGNYDYREGFKFAFLGSAINYCYEPRFINFNQSINYVECHDDICLFDKINKSCNVKYIKDIIKLVNSATSLSFGVPFFHAGQEIGQTKYNETNTYNKGDKYNKFNWDLLDKRIDMYDSFRKINKFRKEIKYINDKKIIESNNYFINFDNNVLGIKLSKETNIKNFDIMYLFNQTESSVKLSLDKKYKVLIGTNEVSNKNDYCDVIELKPFEFKGVVRKDV